jgi:polyhydroxyalkanoate synthesis regulator phasin
MNAFAARLGTTVDKVKEALRGAYSDTIDQAVKDGKLTQDQATQLKNDATNRFSQGIPFGFSGRGGPGGFRGKGGFGFGGPGGFHGEMSMAAFATAMNMNESDLMTELQSGKTIAQVVTEKNLNLSTIKTSVLAALKTNLDQAVSSGKLTQSQADEIYSQAGAKFDNIVNQTWNQGEFEGGLGFGLRGFRGFKGGMDLAAFATALNMNESDLMTELQSGKTLAQVVTEKGADVVQVKTKVLAALKTNLDQAVSSGKLTQTQADAIYNQASTNFDTMVNQTWNQGGPMQDGWPKQ